MKRHVVARASDIPDGGRLIVDVEGKSIGIFNVNGRFHAVLNRCPHQAAQLCRGQLTTGLSSDRPGDFRFDLDKTSIVCPWHGWEFDLETGRSFFDPRNARVRSYDLEIEHGAALAEEIANAERSGGRVPGPYIAEIVSVSTSNDYVVLTF